jgi:thioredoxin 1
MALGPFVEQLSGRYAGMAKVAKIDIDQNPGVTQQYGIRSIPALLVFKGGVVVEQFVGNPGSDAALDQLLRRHL